MTIEYTIVTNRLTTPTSFSARVLSKNTRDTQQIAERIAQRTGQSVELATAFLSALGDEILLTLLDGDTVLLGDIAQISSTLSGRIESATGLLPEGATAGISFRAVGNLLSQFKARAQFLRVAADSTAPEILEVTILSGNLDAMRERDILVIKGNRLSLDGSQPDEGIFLAPLNGGPAVRASIYLDEGDKVLRAQIPNGLLSRNQYQIRVDNRRSAVGLVRSVTWPVPVTTA